MSDRVRVGVLGCGNISRAYLSKLPTFGTIDVVACADLISDRARQAAEKFGVPRSCSPDELLDADDIDLIINLTIPAVHASLSEAALKAGKSVYGEKPLALERSAGLALLDLAGGSGLRVGSAPDTFLGAGFQTCRAVIDEGGIGTPLAGCAFMLSGGPESWHPDPAFFYAPGAGPLFDVGVYYVTALIHLLGPVSRVTGFSRISRAERTSKDGLVIRPTVATHVVGVLEMASGPIVTLVSSFDVPVSRLPRMEIHGTEGTLWGPDPNTFGGPVRVRKPGDTEWTDVALRGEFAEQSRGIGVADMVLAAGAGRPARASGDLALHVLDVMQSILEASETGRAVDITTTVPRPAPLPDGWDGTVEMG